MYEADGEAARDLSLLFKTNKSARIRSSEAARRNTTFVGIVAVNTIANWLRYRYATIVVKHDYRVGSVALVMLLRAR
jgi:hypothetical protein